MDNGGKSAVTRELLHEAARTALAAPSIFNSQPWTWALHDDRLELWADRSRQLDSIDPAGRLLELSCGSALHHALVALTGYRVEADLLPVAQEPDLLALVRLGSKAAAGNGDGLCQAIRVRRTDRRPFQKAPIEGAILDRLARACAGQGAHLHLVPWHQMPTLALAAVGAGALQLADPAYLMELADWTHRPQWSGDGVPIGTAVEPSSRRVPVREFAPFGGHVQPAGLDNDFGASYGIISTATDTPVDWLAAGMGLSAVLLSATAAGLGTAIISDVTEAAVIREHLRHLLPSGFPQVAVRIGYSQPGRPPATPRRQPGDVIQNR